MKHNIKMALVLAVSSFSLVMFPPYVWAQDAVSEAGVALNTQPIPKSEEVLEGDKSKKSHSGHNHEHGEGEHNHEDHNVPKLTLDNTPFAVTEAPDDHVLGENTAPITMIVYASVTCSHCSDWFTNQWPALKKDLVDSGKIRFVMRELPTPPAQMSMVGFMMAECAPAEDYFDIVQYQMENQLKIFKQAEIGKAREEYDKVGKLAGLEDDAAIRTCFENQDNLKHIHINGDRATAAGVQGVPAFYIDGESYKGEQSAQALSDLIENMMSSGQTKLPDLP